ncbi:MAG: outer membrane lipoprotein-sorting protein [Candidatus Schekmanbacteria bacterium]|nr:outer membrane lipoprotein-sorting protein [Candidatus Schekmanbacteria bacterium]
MTRQWLTFVTAGVVSCLALTAMGAAAAQEPTLADVLKKADSARGNAAGLQWTVKMVEVGAKVDEEPTTLLVKVKGENSFAIFLEPTSSKGQKMLMKKNNMWFIKPGVSKPVSISPRQKLMGGAANADIASTNYAGDYEPTVSGKEAVDGVECQIFDLKGKSKNVTYDQIKYWVSVDRSLGLKAEFYSVSGKLLKTAFFKYEQTVPVDGKPSPFVSEMRIQDAVVKDTETVMSYSDVKLADIPDSEFILQN